MATQTATQTTTAQATQHEPEGARQPEQEPHLPEALAEGEEAATAIVRAAVENPRTTLIFVGATGLAALVLFGGGLIRSRGMPRLRRLAARTEEIRIPVAVPVALAEIAWEMISSRREISNDISAVTGSRRTER